MNFGVASKWLIKSLRVNMEVKNLRNIRTENDPYPGFSVRVKITPGIVVQFALGIGLSGVLMRNEWRKSQDVKLALESAASACAAPRCVRRWTGAIRHIAKVHLAVMRLAANGRRRGAVR
ncbi:MAG: hypothetical protein U1E74_04065 [Paenacidovorax caeni]